MKYVCFYVYVHDLLVRFEKKGLFFLINKAYIIYLSTEHRARDHIITEKALWEKHLQMNKLRRQSYERR